MGIPADGRVALMARLIFTEDNHEYRVDGVVYPSVSEIMRFVSREVYDDTNQYAVDRAAERGAAVHKACEALDKYGRIECDEDIASYVTAYVKFLRERKPEWAEIEKSLHHPGLLYAGTLDRTGVMDGETVIVDIKTSYAVNKRLATIQLAAYAMLTMHVPDKLYILHLKPDETYKLHEIPFNPEPFTSCLNLHNHMESTRCDRYKLRMKLEKEKSA